MYVTIGAHIVAWTETQAEADALVKQINTTRSAAELDVSEDTRADVQRWLNGGVNAKAETDEPEEIDVQDRMRRFLAGEIAELPEELPDWWKVDHPD